MSVKNRTFSSWNRDHHKTFAAAIAAELEKKANIDSPNFTGIPTAPTPEQGTRTNQIATTEFVADAVDYAGSNDDKVSKSGGLITGHLTVEMPPSLNSSVYPITIQGHYKDGTSTQSWSLGVVTIGNIMYFRHANKDIVGIADSLGIYPVANGISLGYKDRPWNTAFVKKISTGTADIEIPSKAGTMALVSDIEDILRQHNLIPEEQTTEEQN